jgi:two-component system response regulator YesN
MEKSRELLGSTDLRAYEVAALVGMPDAHYFGQCFKRFTGMTVNEYRQQLRAGRNREKTI